MAQTAVGTENYYSPEKMHNAQHSASKADMWAIGCVLLELLRGERLAIKLWRENEAETRMTFLQDASIKSPVLGQAAHVLLAWKESERIDAAELSRGLDGTVSGAGLSSWGCLSHSREPGGLRGA